MIKKIFGNLKSRVFIIVAAVVLVLLIAVNIVAWSVFQPLLNTVLGGPTAIVDFENSEPIYEKEAASKADAKAAGEALTVDIASEGTVMLLNKNEALPLDARAKISVFGKNSVNLVYSGTGSGAADTSSAKTIFDSLTDADFEYNQALRNFYENNSQSGDGRPASPGMDDGGAKTLSHGETPLSSYTGGIGAYIGNYTDAALVVVSRAGGEGWDLPRSTSGLADAYPDNHYLQLDRYETELLAAVSGAGFGHVIVVINSPNAVELGFLDDPDNYAFNSEVDGCLWVGTPGSTGIMALGKILSGEVNPSGRLIDTYARNFKKDPTWQNIGDQSQVTANGAPSASLLYNSSNSEYFAIDYEEGIYVGYRYYETRGFIAGEEWYKDNVVYPFGYGLSYTEFDWSISNKPAASPALVKQTGIDYKIDQYKIDVKVTNTGNRPGKDVVQLYATVPYIAGGIEKSHVALIDFAKTPVLYPASEAGDGKPNEVTLTLKFNTYDLASYDYNDANGNGFIGYELDPGDYIMKISRDAHTPVDSVTYTLGTGIEYVTDPNTDYKVENRFPEADDRLADVTVGGKTRKGMSRSDFAATWPSPETTAERAITQEQLAKLNSMEHNNPIVVTEMPTMGAPVTSTIWDVVGQTDYNYWAWESILDSLTANEMLALLNNGNFKTVQIEKIDKPLTYDTDGPVGFVNFMSPDLFYGTCSYATSVVVASTWNRDLAYKMGRSVGEEGLWGNDKGDKLPYSGWYAPAVNIHRSPFSGRNYEYYSEDPTLSGIMAVGIINGAKTKGVYTDLKHFAVNDQETYRDALGLSTWLTEQSMREIYFKPFEMAVKGDDMPSETALAVAAAEGIENYKYTGTTGIMSAFNRIGYTWTGGDYRLLTEVLRNEWGFHGLVITDFSNPNYMNTRQMHYAGGDLNLTTLQSKWWRDFDVTDAADVYILRNATKNILYTVANSNAMNNKILGYTVPLWQILLIIATCVIPAGLAVWGFFAIRAAVKTRQEL